MKDLGAANAKSGGPHGDGGRKVEGMEVTGGEYMTI